MSEELVVKKVKREIVRRIKVDSFQVSALDDTGNQIVIDDQGNVAFGNGPYGTPEEIVEFLQEVIKLRDAAGLKPKPPKPKKKHKKS